MSGKDTNNAIPPDTVIGSKYRIVKRIGSGSFGEIYSGTQLYDANQQVAIKFEKKTARCPQLRHEFKVYRELQGCQGIGRVLYYGSYRELNVMVMELLGPSLEDLFNKCGRKFSLKTTLKLADQLIERVDALHENHLIHRDIKPANFVIGLPSSQQSQSGQDGSQRVFCIDFGLSKRYRHPHSLQHIPYKEGRSLTGTPRYASVANHRGIETSRRDDLESIGYILIYFLQGRLPWQGLKLPANAAGTASQKHRLILDKKQLTSLSELCRGLPREFQEYLQYCRDLHFEAKPDINHLRGMFRRLYIAQGFEENAPWDWEVLHSSQTSKKKHTTNFEPSQQQQQHAIHQQTPKNIQTNDDQQRYSQNLNGGWTNENKQYNKRPTSAKVSTSQQNNEKKTDTKDECNQPQKSTTTTPTATKNTFQTSVAAVATRPWTAASDAATGVVSHLAGNFSSSQERQLSFRARFLGSGKQQQHDQSEVKRNDNEISAGHGAISSRDQVVVTYGNDKKNSKHRGSKQYDDVIDRREDNNKSRPSTAPSQGGRSRSTWRFLDSSTGNSQKARRSGPSAWGSSDATNTGDQQNNYEYNQNGNSDNDYFGNVRYAAAHFGGTPLSLVRHRRSQQRPQSGNPTYRYSSGGGSSNGLQASGYNPSSQGRSLWGQPSSQSRYQSSAWSSRPKTSSRPASAARTASTSNPSSANRGTSKQARSRPPMY